MPYVMIFSMSSKSFSTTYFGSVLDNRQAGGGHLINCAVADTKYKYINFKTQQQQREVLILLESKIQGKMQFEGHIDVDLKIAKINILRNFLKL